MQMNPNNIPKALKDKGLWCVWRYEERDGKPTKVPYNPQTGNRARPNEKQDFSGFETALNAFERGGFDGLGIGIFPPLAAVDIDHSAASGKLTDMAAEILGRIGRYTEYSPSGKGVHIVFTVPDGFNYDKETFYINNRALGLEVYVAGCTYKFITITGDIIGGDLTNGGNVLDDICRKYMMRKQPMQTARGQASPYPPPSDGWFGRAMKDRKFSDFWNGIFSKSDESANDAALMEKLLYYCNGNVNTAIDFFKLSPYAQKKDEAHQKKMLRDDYLLRTALNVMPDKIAHDDTQNNLRRMIAICPHPELVERLDKIQPDLTYSWDDKGFGDLFADIFRDKCRFNVTANQWMNYDSRMWVIDERAMEASKRAKELVNALSVYCTHIEDERKRTEYSKIVLKYGQNKYRETMLKDARDKYFIRNSDLDANLALLNCQNGTFNLNDYSFKPHSPRDLLSKISNVIYLADATASPWDKFIAEVMQNDAEKIDYLQKILGYSLTAETTLETCWILYGATTRNGKSTLVETISYMLGGAHGYSMTTQPQTLAMKQNKDTRQASGDIARLAGCRFLNASEPPKKMLFDCALLKTLLGRDAITCRRLYESEFEYIPMFKLFINTNYLPLMQDDSIFSSGRVNVITFDKHFSRDEQDTGLKERLKNPQIISGIFLWCIEGLKKYREHGATPPQSVRNATEEYRQSSDKIGLFISECLQKTGKNSLAGKVYQCFSDWCEANGYGTESKTNFFDELKIKGIFAPSGTVDGKGVRNIVRGYEIISNIPP